MIADEGPVADPSLGAALLSVTVAIVNTVTAL
jgi:hypothetical protein